MLNVHFTGPSRFAACRDLGQPFRQLQVSTGQNDLGHHERWIWMVQKQALIAGDHEPSQLKLVSGLLKPKDGLPSGSFAIGTYREDRVDSMRFFAKYHD